MILVSWFNDGAVEEKMCFRRTSTTRKNYNRQHHNVPTACSLNQAKLFPGHAKQNATNQNKQRRTRQCATYLWRHQQHCSFWKKTNEKKPLHKKSRQALEQPWSRMPTEQSLSRVVQIIRRQVVSVTSDQLSKNVCWKGASLLFDC